MPAKRPDSTNDRKSITKSPLPSRSSCGRKSITVASASGTSVFVASFFWSGAAGVGSLSGSSLGGVAIAATNTSLSP